MRMRPFLLGPVLLAAILSACSDSETTKPEGCKDVTSSRINDWEFTGNRFFFLGDPDGVRPRIDLSTVRVWLDDRDLVNNNVEPTVVWPNPAFVMLSGERDDPIRVEGRFHRLELNGDFTLEREIYFGHTLLALRRPLRVTSPSEILGVAYVESLFAGQTFVGLDTVGTVAPGPSDSLFLKAIMPPEDVLDQTDLRLGPWAPTRKLMLRNVYSLRREDIDLDALTVRVRRDEGTQTPDRLGGVPFLRIVGLDRLRFTGTHYVFGQDGRVDWDRVAPSSGFLVLPDLRPFAPDDADLARMGGAATALEDRGMLLTDPEDQNAHIYDLPTSQIRPELHTRYYFEIEYCED